MTLYTGCLGHWPLSEGAGTAAADASSVGNNGTLSAASWYDDATYGWVFHANNGDDVAATNYVNCGNVPLTGVTNAFTVALRFYRTGSPANSYMLGKSLSTARGFRLFSAGSATRIFNASDATTEPYIQDSDDWPGAT